MSKVKGIEQRSRGFYAVRDVPRPLQAGMGKRRLVKSLETRDPHVAKARNYLAQAAFQRLIDVALKGTSEAAGVEAGLAWRATFDALQNGDMALIKRWGGELDHNPQHGPARWSPGETAGLNLDEQFNLEVESIGEVYGHEQAALMRGLADGSATPTLLNVEPWLSEGGVKGPLTDRTKRQYRSDLGAMDLWFKTIGVATVEGVTKKAAGRYVAEALLAVGVNRTTANRKISAPSAYWKWLAKRGHAEINPWLGQSLSKGTDDGDGVHGYGSPVWPVPEPLQVRDEVICRWDVRWCRVCARGRACVESWSRQEARRSRWSAL